LHALDETEGGFTPPAWLSLRNVRERLCPFLGISLVLFVLRLVAQAASVLLGSGVFWLYQLQEPPTCLAILLFSYALVGPALLVLSQFALAMPAVILDDCRVGQAMFRGEEPTEGKWLSQRHFWRSQ
jgi:hypothetical protein